MSQQPRRRKWGHKERPVELRTDEWVAFSLKNEGRDVVDLTLLVVDSEYGIEAIFPTPFGLDNRLNPGENLTREFRVTVGLPGREHLILIAAKARQNEIPFDFSFLGQPSIERARSAAGRVG